MAPTGFYTEEVRAGGERVSSVHILCWVPSNWSFPPPSSFRDDRTFTHPPTPSSPLPTQTGFDVVTLGSGQRGPLARVGKAKAGQPTVGSYVVDLPSFENLALPSLALNGASGSRKRARESTATAAAAGDGASSGNGSSGRPRVVVIDEVREKERCVLEPDTKTTPNSIPHVCPRDEH